LSHYFDTFLVLSYHWYKSRRKKWAFSI